MIFKHPSLLYGLLFLLVPIIVHLFQLRRFTKVDFTNVAFLKPLIANTRKSRQLKKWLSLLARLLIVACIVFAFAQPFIPAKNAQDVDTSTIIYLDNSFSMQAEGKNGALFNAAVNDLLQSLPYDKQVTVITNDRVYRDETKTSLTNNLLKATYSSERMSLKDVSLKAQTLAGDNRLALLILSDFQKHIDDKINDLPVLENVSLLKYAPQSLNNISIDSAYIKSKVNNNLKIAVNVSANHDFKRPITVDFYNKGLLLSKTSVTLENRTGTAIFDIEARESIVGRISIEDDGLYFDNDFYIAYDNKQKLKVLSINDANDSFLNRIYQEDPFEYSSFMTRDLNFNLIKDQNIIVLNEIEEIPPSLDIELKKFTNKGGKLIIIPSDNTASYGSLLPEEYVFLTREKKVSQINYDHPVMSNVFNKRIDNFQYPKVQKSFILKSSNPILKYEDGTAFLSEQNSKFIFSAPLNNENSNFKNSPLIVPVFYNMAMSSLPLPRLYNFTNTRTEVAINKSSKNDEVFTLRSKDTELIPRQRSFTQFTELQFENEVDRAGNYEVIYEEQLETHLAFNFNRSENNLSYYNDTELQNSNSNALDSLFIQMAEDEQITSLWRLFLYAALFFLLCEVLILKLMK